MGVWSSLVASPGDRRAGGSAATPRGGSPRRAGIACLNTRRGRAVSQEGGVSEGPPTRTGARPTAPREGDPMTQGPLPRRAAGGLVCQGGAAEAERTSPPAARPSWEVPLRRGGVRRPRLGGPAHQHAILEGSPASQDPPQWAATSKSQSWALSLDWCALSSSFPSTSLMGCTAMVGKTPTPQRDSDTPVLPVKALSLSM